MAHVKKIGLVGGRGYVGAELIELLASHNRLELAFASSTSKAGEQIQGSNLSYLDITPSTIANELSGIDALVLALPNGVAANWVAAVQKLKPELCMLDISADYRFDDAWVYGLTEINFAKIKGATRIANPGCYATAAQLALQPLQKQIRGKASIFGVSGYSGAGATPGPRNDAAKLKDNLIPYSMAGHIHEREISYHLGTPVRFSPHVAGFFRGISLTIHVQLNEPASIDDIINTYSGFYAKSTIVTTSSEIPEISQIAGTPNARIGGFKLDDSGCELVLVSVIDNLLKGAASQAIQNLELALQ